MTPSTIDPSAPHVRELRTPPHAAWFMTRAAWPRPRALVVPALALRRTDVTVPRDELALYRRLTGQPEFENLPMEWPQVWSFRLQMALLTERRFPLPIWSALQVRNALCQHEPLPLDARYTINVQPGAVRHFDKGTEIDVLTTFERAGRLVWQGRTSFYWRGRAKDEGRAPPAEAASPSVEGAPLAAWDSGAGDGWRFGALTGDYNGLHWSDAYARAFGFARAFHHSPRIAGQCLAHLQRELHAPRQSLTLWIKGPVTYRSALALRAADAGRERLFALHVDGDARPALVGRWSPWSHAQGGGESPV